MSPSRAAARRLGAAHLLSAAAAGAGAALASGPLDGRVDLSVLPWFALSAWLWAVLDRRADRPLLLGWAAGMTTSLVGFWWIAELVRDFAGLPWAVGLGGLALLSAYQGLQWAGFAWALRRLADRLGLSPLLVAPLAFAGLEWAMPLVFPYHLAMTQAWTRPFVQISDLFGAHAVSALIVLTNAALAVAGARWLDARRIAWRPLAVAGAALAATLAYGQWRIAAVEASRARAPTLTVGMVQANTSMQTKWDGGSAAAELARHQRFSRELERRGAELILWPETAYPFVLSREQDADFSEQQVGRIREGFAAPLVFGALTVDPRAAETAPPFNSALYLASDGRIAGRYDKRELLLFGERLPLAAYLGWLQDMIPTIAQYQAGAGPGVIAFGLAGRAVRLGPLICYEDILPAYVNEVSRLGPNLLVNLTNDAWFGASAAPRQHLRLAAFRAVEQRLDLVRATNTGVSAVVDATGLLRSEGPLVDPDRTPDAPPALLVASAALMPGGSLFRDAGDVFGPSCLVLTAALLAMTMRRGRSKRPS